jgi:hypothetical protein
MNPVGAHAFLALWNSVEREGVAHEYEVWHTHEHVPERVGSPGFIEAVRCRSVGDATRFFTCYWLRSLDALSSDAYRQLVAHPTPWSRRMRAELGHFVRMPCELSGSVGVSSARYLAALHLGERAGGAETGIAAMLAREQARAGLVSAQWGRCHPVDDFPLANQTPRSEAPSHVLLLQHTELAALRERVQALLRALAPLARPLAEPDVFECLTQVRQSALKAPLTRRQPARADLFERFHPGDKA